jgi:hypothetical protein
MPVSATKTQHNKKVESQAHNPHALMTHAEYKEKLLGDPDVKNAYDALEPEYQQERANIKKAIGKRSNAKPA